MSVTAFANRYRRPDLDTGHGPLSARWITAALGFLVLLSWLGAAPADDAPTGDPNVLQSVGVAALPGNKLQLTLTMQDPAAEPRSFTIDNPARIALDFPNTRMGLERRNQGIGIGVAKSLTAVEAQGRTRVVLNLVRMTPHTTVVDGNKVIVTLNEVGGTSTAAAAATGDSAPEPADDAEETAEETAAAPAPAPATAPERVVRNIDFRRGEQGQGRVVVTLSDPSIPVDMRTEGGDIVLDFYGARLPERLQRRLDVLDFATPVQTIDAMQRDENVHMEISPVGEYDHLAYQTDDRFVIEVKETTKEEKERRLREQVVYTGDRLSLNFQNIEVRSVLQLIADFTGINVVVSDTVSGNITLRLKNVPWDQALDIILKTKGLAMRKHGNVMLIAPSEEIAAREKLELESQKQIEELAPVYSEFIQINYAKAEDIAVLLKSPENSLLTEGRGTVTVDQRTNTLLVQDTAAKLEEIRALVERLDIPVRQVLIESRVVIANNDFSKDLGARVGGLFVGNNDDKGVISGTGSITTASDGDQDPKILQPFSGNDSVAKNAVGNIQSSGQPFPITIPNPEDRLMVDLPVDEAAGRFALAILSSDYLLDIELSAMQAEGRGEIISSPRVITSNQKEAVIKQGVEIPYLQATSSGATNVAFKEAVLSLKVTPQITPDDRIILDLAVNKDSVGQVFLGVPSINTREVSTQVLVDNGETVVLGGVYEQTKLDESDKVPFLGDLPGIGALFRQTRKTDDKSELLIFVTPKIVKQSLGIN